MLIFCLLDQEVFQVSIEKLFEISKLFLCILCGGKSSDNSSLIVEFSDLYFLCSQEHISLTGRMD